jgi:ectoine hydroxylase-related dioxygenase (phytanoyl-CoA dioxygenase family)
MLDDRFGPLPTTPFDLAPTKAQVEFFRENGFLKVERITTDEEVAWLRKVMEYIFSEEYAGKPGSPLDRSGTAIPGQAPARLSQSFFPEIHFPRILDTQFRRNAKRFAAALLDVPEKDLSGWGHMIQKMPGGRAASWHQDHAYWQPELDYYALGVWLPLHDVTVPMGAMQFIPGSHKLGLLRHRQEDEPQHNVLTVDEPIDFSKAVPCPLKMGGCTFHHSETLHYTAPNTTDQVRLAFPTEFQINPVRRKVPAVMPWVDEFRKASGGRTVAKVSEELMYVADGKVIHI